MKDLKKTITLWVYENTTVNKSNTQMDENIKSEGQDQVQGHQM